MVFYRKYRPQVIADLDNALVREKLTAALSSANVPHAFLFTGPKGLGKTSTARIVAKAVNCESHDVILSRSEGSRKKGREDSSAKPQNDKGNSIEPCNTCHQCVSITNGTNLDVLEIDGASNRGIDEIRDLQEKINLAPFSAKKKVYIIDEVHMLTTEAFNALLKTLEEPPSHALFILCTTESHKVPATIASRCFQIAFSRATAEELVRSFQRILQGEKLQADEEALLEIAKVSDGSFRDGAKALEEVVGLAHSVSSGQAKEKITKELVERKFQISNIQLQISNLLQSMGKKDTKAGLQLVGKLVEQGIDMKYFVEQLISELHEMLLFQVGINSSKFNPPAGGQNSKLMLEDIKKLVELLSKAHGEIKYAVLPQLPLELVLVEWGVSRVTNNDAEVTNENFLVHDAKKGLSLDSIQEPANANSEDFVGSPRQESSISFLSGAQTTSITRGKEENKDRDFWFSFLDSVKKENHTIAGVLRGCHMVRYDDTELVIEAKYKFHAEKLEEKKTRDILEKACQEITGKTVKVLIVLKEK